MKFLFNILIICLVISCKLFSQDYSFRVYDNKVGLNSPEIFTVFIDSRGFIWLGGADGLTRFDGKNFKNYNKTDGLVDDFVLTISEDNNNNLLIGTKKGISVFNGHSFTTLKIRYKNAETKKISFQSILCSSNGKIYAGSVLGLFIYNSKTRTFDFDKRINDFVSEIIEEDDVIYLTTSKGLYLIKNNKITNIKLDSTKRLNNLTAIKSDFNRVKWIGSTNGIIRCSKTDTIKFFTNLKSKSHIQDILINRDSSILFTSNSSEVMVFKNDIFKSYNLTPYIQKATISKAVKDNTGNIWLVTSSGLVKMYRPILKKHFLTDAIHSPVSSLSVDANKHLFLGSINGLIKYDGKNVSFFYPSKNSDDLFITALASIDSAMLVGTYSGKVFEFRKNKFTLLDSSLKSGDCVYKIIQVNKNEYWYCGLKDTKGHIWFANINKLSVFKNSTFKTLNDNGIIYDQFATLSEDNNNTIWVGTYGNGLLKYNGKHFTNVSKTNGLCDNFISSSYYDKSKNILWVGTMNGISKINLDTKSNILSIDNLINNPNIESFGRLQNAIEKLPNGNILFSIGEELYEYDYKSESKLTTQLKLSLQGLKLNHQNINLNEFALVDNWSNVPLNLTLPFEKNKISFDFVAIDYNFANTLKYSWKLEGIEKEWTPLTENNSVSFTNLPGGNYTFRVRATNEHGEYSNEIMYSFTILPPFYQTWWFLPLLLIILFTIAYLNSEYQIKKVKAEEKTKTENFKRLAELELKAMRAQMNPHFMFNTLNSIQDIVLNKDDEKARIYLADFALMMRMILENSTQKEISFEKEIEFIQLYLKMEVLRFETKFRIIFNISEELELSHLKIPPMLIQPYIENAINHGLMHKTENGLLTISFEIETRNEIECLKCTVLDNGIGRKKAKEYAAWKTKKHQSMATEITNERLQLLNGIHTAKGFEVNIHDLENESHEALGTKVELYIPIN
jgi:ligand-binding sensor domain-containing protein